MAEVFLESKPATTGTQFTAPERYILYTRTLGQVKGDRFIPQNTLNKSTIKILSKISELEYQSLETNPIYNGVVSRLENGTTVKEVGQVFEGKLYLNELAPEKFQQNQEVIRELAIASSQETISNSGYVDASNQTPNTANTPESVGDLKSQATPLDSKQNTTSNVSPTPNIGPAQTRKIKRSSSSSYLSYPIDMDASQDRIEFTAMTYAKKSISNAQTTITSIDPAGLNLGQKESEKDFDPADKPVFLPISNKIQDSNGVDWNEDRINELQRFGASASLKVMGVNENTKKFDMGTPGDHLTEFMNFMKTTGAGNLARLWLAGQAVQVNGLLTRATGAIINPNLELLFNGPQLRQFQFTFGLIGKSSKESAQIKEIINYFKKNMAVKDNNNSIGSGGPSVFLGSPNVFKIRYLNGTETHKSINQIKMCALLNCSVDYTPMGSYMTYNDDDGSASMFMYSLSLQFKELTPIYSSDYDGHPIGY